jgi:hypothetical protein
MARYGRFPDPLSADELAESAGALWRAGSGYVVVAGKGIARAISS